MPSLKGAEDLCVGQKPQSQEALRGGDPQAAPCCMELGYSSGTDEGEVDAQIVS